MNVPTFVVAVVALVLSGAALTWNVLTYLWQGQRAKLSVSVMNALSPGYKEPFLEIAVSAPGRQPFQIVGWAITYGSNKHIHSAIAESEIGSSPVARASEKLPALVNPGRRVTFNVPVSFIDQVQGANGLDPGEGHVQVFFAARRTLRDRNSLAAHLNTSS